MTYAELISEKNKVITERERLERYEKELDAKIEKANYSYAQTLLDEICEKIRKIEELGFRIYDDNDDWISLDGIYLERYE